MLCLGVVVPLGVRSSCFAVLSLREKGISMRNVGGIDRALRIIVGCVLIVATLMGAIGAWGWIGVLPLATGLLGSCPAYKLIGFSS